MDPAPCRVYACYTHSMARKLTQRELRNNSGEIMRALDRGESFIVTRNGVPVGDLVPTGTPTFISALAAQAALAGAPRIDAERFRRDIDVLLDQNPSPRV